MNEKAKKMLEDKDANMDSVEKELQIELQDLTERFFDIMFPMDPVIHLGMIGFMERKDWEYDYERYKLKKLHM